MVKRQQWGLPCPGARATKLRDGERKNPALGKSASACVEKALRQLRPRGRAKRRPDRFSTGSNGM